MNAPPRDDHTLSPALKPGEIPRWDVSPLAQEIFLLANLMQRAADRLVARHQLTATRWLLTAALEHFERPPSLTELAADGLMTVQNVSRLVASMEADGLVERFTVQGRGRQVFVKLTARGEQACHAAEEDAKRFARHFLDGLSNHGINHARDTLDTLIRNTQRLERELIAEQSNGTHAR